MPDVPRVVPVGGIVICGRGVLTFAAKLVDLHGILTGGVADVGWAGAAGVLRAGAVAGLAADAWLAGLDFVARGVGWQLLKGGEDSLKRL